MHFAKSVRGSLGGFRGNQLQRNIPQAIGLGGSSKTGKTTLSALVAARLNRPLIDQGQIFRAIAYLVLQTRGITEVEASPTEEKLQLMRHAVSRAADTLTIKNNISMDRLRCTFAILANGTDITDALESPTIGMAASKLAKFDFVREVSSKMQRDFARDKNDRNGLVVTGRAVEEVFPGAFHFWLHAPLRIRAKREANRQAQILGRKNATSQEIRTAYDQLRSRDVQDKTRIYRPVRVPKGAIRLDSSLFSPEELLFRIDREIKKSTS
jgi:cytidylate kinase